MENLSILCGEVLDWNETGLLNDDSYLLEAAMAFNEDRMNGTLTKYEAVALMEEKVKLAALRFAVENMNDQ